MDWTDNIPYHDYYYDEPEIIPPQKRPIPQLIQKTRPSQPTCLNCSNVKKKSNDLLIYFVILFLVTLIAFNIICLSVLSFLLGQIKGRSQ